MRHLARTALVLLASVASSLTSACAKAPEPSPFRAVAGNRLLMMSVVDPAADVVWDSVRTVMTLEGTEEFQPETDAEWEAVRNSSVILAEAGNLLMMERRAMDQGDWIGWSAALIDAGEDAMKAADARNPQAVFDAGGEIYAACSGCHAKYLIGNAAPAGS
jgi:hypothetical protein